MKRLVIFILIVGGLVYVMRDSIRPYFEKDTTKIDTMQQQSKHEATHEATHEHTSKKQELVSATMDRLDAYNDAGK